MGKKMVKGNIKISMGQFLMGTGKKVKDMEKGH
jgi:hypothetical protein